ncbi:MAG: indolepyruvate ferredoxin oxidoreductase subunit alpha, partial [Gammaproteobacteria bacterium]|nr:indolepyruvate ferredoxin oxidoreductase subunit alpha [Gammaproteobacteria bacterium]
MERSFAKEVTALKLGEGEIFHGEGILAMTKALLQSGVSYVGGYQGAPVSHMMDVLGDAQEILDDLGVHYESCPSEAAAAAMLGASINYPLRGAVVWKSVVGTNVASDALSNVASAGVKGGALIILGEDYGEGASIIQERTHAFAMKSSIWLLDPRPNHQHFVGLIERAFELSEVSNTPVMVEFRIRACHVYGSFETRDNRKPEFSRNRMLSEPEFDYSRICLPPSTYLQEKHKIEFRRPAAQDYIRANKLNEVFPGTVEDVGLIIQGGMYNSLMRALVQVGLADSFGNSKLSIYVLNVTYPLVPDEVIDFCRDKKAVLIVEEGQPDYLEQEIHSVLRKSGMDTALHGKGMLPMAGEYTVEVLLNGLTAFMGKAMPGHPNLIAVQAEAQRVAEVKEQARELLGNPIPARPPGFCVGCPERPVFSAIKLVEEKLGKIHISADIGCHTFSTLPPFNLGNTVLGYGMSLASSTGVAPAFDKRVLSIMGDGGFWHNGLTSGVVGAQFNKNDSILMVIDNNYTSATGQQYIPSTSGKKNGRFADISIKGALRGLGVRWVRKVNSYSVRGMVKTLTRAMTTSEGGLKVIIAEGECQLANQRRFRPWFRERLDSGKRVVKTRFGVDSAVCTGDHSCIRLSGCPSLTIKPNP